MREKALDWLYRQLKKKRIALGRAETKPNTPESEMQNIQSDIEVIDWIIGELMKGEWHG